MVAQIREKHNGALAEQMDVRVWLRMLSCSTTIEKRLRRRFADRFGTTLPRFDVLAALERATDGTTMSELSRSLLVSNGNLTAIVKHLERDGLIVSRSSPEDKRSQIVALTDKGRDHFAELAEFHHEWIRTMFSGMRKDDLQQIFSLLSILKSSLAAEINSE